MPVVPGENAEVRVLVFQHIACEHPGSFREFMRDDGIEWHAVELDEGEPIPALEAFDALMVMGGPMDVWQKAEHAWLEAEIEAIRTWVADMRRPYLGFCLGHQLLAVALGGSVAPAREPEIGVMNVELSEAGKASPFFAGIAEEIPCFQWHSAEVTRLPEGAEVLASSRACAVNAMACGPRAVSIQFHIEITPKTVSEWGGVPEYAEALERALGEGALARIERDAAARMARFETISRQLYTNFMGVVRAG